MAFRIECKELGIQDCNFTATGETVDDVLAQVVDHLRSQHDIDMPDPDVILEGKATNDPLGEPDADVALVVQRLVELLNIEPPPSANKPDSPIPPTSEIADL